MNRLTCALTLAISVVVLGGCARSITSTPGDAPNLETWTAEIKNKKPKAKTDDLPVLTNVEVFDYSKHLMVTPGETALASNASSAAAPTAVGAPYPLRDPFSLPVASADEPAATQVRPDRDRPKQELESFALDTLKMVGTMGQGEHLVGLVMSPDNIVHRVAPGQYLGQQDGKVTSIENDRVNLIEIVSDGEGGWTEKPTSLVVVSDE